MSASALSVDVEVLAELPAKSMLQLLERKQKCDKFFQQCATTMRDFAPLFRFLEERDIDLRIDPDYCYVSINLSGTGEQFSDVWAELRRHHFMPGHRPKAGDVEYSGYFDREGYVRLLLYFTSTQCKRVKVGTKLVEQDIYETQCGDPVPEIETDNAVIRAAALPAPSETLPF